MEFIIGSTVKWFNGTSVLTGEITNEMITDDGQIVWVITCIDTSADHDSVHVLYCQKDRVQSVHDYALTQE